jgi:predicted HicB family RNase H-like nuclease
LKFYLEQSELTFAIIILMNRKQQRIFDAIFATLTKANIKFSDIEKLLVALGAEKFEGSGSRVAFVMPNGAKWEHHCPHPNKEAKKYQVESVREFLKGWVSEMNSLMNYKGFAARIEFSADDNVFVGQLIGIDDIVMFEAETVDELKTAFEEAVDFHIEVCKKTDKKAKKTYSGELLFNLPAELHARIAEAAANKGVSINEFGKEVFESAISN